MTYRDKSEADQAKIAALERELAVKNAALAARSAGPLVELEPVAFVKKRSLRRVGFALVLVLVLLNGVAIAVASAVGMPGYAERWLVLLAAVTAPLVFVAWIVAIAGTLHRAPVGAVLLFRVPHGLRVIEPEVLAFVPPWMPAHLLHLEPQSVTVGSTVSTRDQKRVHAQVRLLVQPQRTLEAIERSLASWAASDSLATMQSRLSEKIQVSLSDIASATTSAQWTTDRDELQDKLELLIAEPADKMGLQLVECTLTVQSEPAASPAET
jgi:hypothetical protein